MGIETIIFFLLIFGLGFFVLDSRDPVSHPLFANKSRPAVSSPETAAAGAPERAKIAWRNKKEVHFTLLVQEFSQVMGKDTLRLAGTHDPMLGHALRLSRNSSGEWFVRRHAGGEKVVLNLKELPALRGTLTNLEVRYPELSRRSGRIMISPLGIHARLPGGPLLRLS